MIKHLVANSTIRSLGIIGKNAFNLWRRCLTERLLSDKRSPLALPNSWSLSAGPPHGCHGRTQRSELVEGAGSAVDTVSIRNGRTE